MDRLDRAFNTVRRLIDSGPRRIAQVKVQLLAAVSERPAAQQRHPRVAADDPRGALPCTGDGAWHHYQAGKVVKANLLTEREINGSFGADHRLAAYFFLPLPEDRSLKDLVDAAGMTDVDVIDLDGAPDAELVSGFWDGVWGYARSARFSHHLCLEIYYGEYRFYGLGTGDPLLVLAEVFRDACEHLDPEMAFVVTQPRQARLEWIAERIYIYVIGLEAEIMARKHFGLLYLKDWMGEEWTGRHAGEDDRLVLAAAAGTIIFADRSDS